MCVETKKQQAGEISIDEMDPTFLFIWKGTRQKDMDASEYRSHDHLEIAYVFSGEGKYRIEDRIYTVREGDLLIINSGDKHQSLCCPEAEVPSTEFFVGFSDIRIAGCPDNFLPLPGGQHVLHTAGELRQRQIGRASCRERV